MCGYILFASVNVSLWRQRYFCSLRRKFHLLHCSRGNPLRPSCEGKVENKIHPYFPLAVKLTSSILGQLTLNVVSEFVSISKLIDPPLIIGVDNCIQLSPSGTFSFQPFFDLPLTVHSTIGTTD